VVPLPRFAGADGARTLAPGHRAKRSRKNDVPTGRTHKKDSLAAPKIMACNDFLHFARCAPPLGLTRRHRLLRDGIALAAQTRSSETRMDTGFLPTHDGPKRAVTFLLTRVPGL
jgi:hypothetical protein